MVLIPRRSFSFMEDGALGFCTVYYNKREELSSQFFASYRDESTPSALALGSAHDTPKGESCRSYAAAHGCELSHPSSKATFLTLVGQVPFDMSVEYELLNSYGRTFQAWGGRWPKRLFASRLELISDPDAAS